MSVRTRVAAVAVAALVLLLAAPAQAADDVTPAGQWTVTEENSGFLSWTMELKQSGDHHYLGRVADKSEVPELCWPEGEDIIDITGEGTHYTGTVQLYRIPGCEPAKRDRITFDLSPDGATAEVLIGAACAGCQPETWVRVTEPGPSFVDIAQTWAIRIGAGLVVFIVLLITLAVLRSRARRRRRQRLAAQVRVVPRPGPPVIPQVRTPHGPGIAVTIHPRLVSGEPIVREATP